jgi:flagellar FliJ protein
MNDRFDFKLQRVLDYREYVKDKKCEELAKYREMLELEKNTLHRLQDQKRTVAGEMDEKCSEGVTAAYLVQCSRYMNRLKDFIDRQTANVSDIEKQVEICRDQLIDASKKKEMMDRLRARHYERFAYHLSKEQEKQLEDLVNNRRSTI